MSKRFFEIIDDGSVSEQFEAPDIDAAVQYMKEWMAGAEFDTSNGPVWYYAALHEVSEQGDVIAECIHNEEIRFDPPEPDCVKVDHDWRAPLSVVGGIKENPGVYGKGGGVIQTEVCRHCGAYKVTDTWYQRPDTGEEGLRAVFYREPDDTSREWVESLVEDKKGP